MTKFQVEKTSGGQGAEGEYKVTESAPMPRWEAGMEFRHVGRPHPRVEGDDKVTGRAQYSCDIRLPGQLVARVLRSPHPHARIRRIDMTRAEALPGVHAVLSSANAPEITWYEDSFAFDPHLRFAGEEVAAVAAESDELAEDALRLIEVEYEVLPFVVDIERAVRPDAPKLRNGGNISGEPTVYERGDIETGLGEAEVVVDRVYTTQAALHNSLEPHG